MIILLFLYSFFQTTKSSSLVIDKFTHDAVYVRDYCPMMEYCPEGAHTMCMYYNHRQKFGPRCANPRNISMTPEVAKKLLDVSNAIRSKIANGKERGKGEMKLPRGYGIFRLNWDSELATFAQVFANQCMLGHDLCRATKKFQDPGQIVGEVRFTFPDWNLVKNQGLITTPDLTQDKLLYAAIRVMKSWYNQKNYVTENMIVSYPDWIERPDDAKARLYLEMIQGPATHMGCGISAYTVYNHFNHHNYNAVEIICNYSGKPRKGMAAYNTLPPEDPALNGPCGCPDGSTEDDDCLCNFAEKEKEGIKTCSDPNSNCKPTVILLPIFSIEDAPPEKLMVHSESKNATLGHDNSLEIFNSLEKTENSLVTLNYGKKRPVSPHAFSTYHRTSFKKPIINIKNRYFNRNNSQNYLKQTLTHKKKLSIFAKQEKFQLPSKNKVVQTKSKILKDVVPRKDFTPKKSSKITNEKQNNKLNQRKVIDHNEHQEKPTEIILKSAEEKVMSYNKNLRNGASDIEDNKIIKEDADNKLMVLLDNLEREVKNIELDGKEKKLFDAKIRKIYGTVVGKTDIHREEPEFKKRIVETDNPNQYSKDKKPKEKDRYQLERLDRKKDEFTDQEDSFLDVKRKDDYYEPFAKHKDLLAPRHILRNNEDSLYRKNNLKYRKEVGERKIKRVEDRHYDDPLSVDRRRFYQAKLEKIEKKLRDSKSYKRRSESKLSMRPTEEFTRGRSKNQINPFYMHDGAKYLHY